MEWALYIQDPLTKVYKFWRTFGRSELAASEGRFQVKCYTDRFLRSDYKILPVPKGEAPRPVLT